ncbi:hypothetical protein [Paraburkholderia ultramafica]|nr:hypothetical protein [Paraburkholderia ultramafica]
MAHFTDYFRFAMFTKTDQIWIDTDMLLLRDFDLDAPGDLIGKETSTSICTALLPLPCPILPLRPAAAPTKHQPD